MNMLTVVIDRHFSYNKVLKLLQSKRNKTKTKNLLKVFTNKYSYIHIQPSKQAKVTSIATLLRISLQIKG